MYVYMAHSYLQRIMCKNMYSQAKHNSTPSLNYLHYMSYNH